MVAIVDYGVGNVFSLKSSLDYIGEKSVVTGNEQEILKADKIILPGVGAFSDAAEKLNSTGLGKLVCSEAKKGKPVLGICLGMQLLFTKSYEYGEFNGLNLIKGNISPIKAVVPEDCKVPHIGWNALSFPDDKPKNEIFKYINEGDCVYFVHSYYGTDCKDSVIANTEYYATLTAAVADKNVYGTQFHPEKSGDVGLKILKAFCEL